MSALPIAWVEKIFQKLHLTYGDAFLSQYRTIKDLADVKTDWAHELGGYQKVPEAIAWALANLPVERPPKVLEFRELCRKAPRKEAQAALPAPADPARVAAELERLAVVRKQAADTVALGGREWAHRLAQRMQRDGWKPTAAARRMLAAALPSPSSSPEQPLEGA